jgi:hypothetical protein
MRGMFQVAFWLIRLETTISVEWIKLGKEGEGEKNPGGVPNWNKRDFMDSMAGTF